MAAARELEALGAAALARRVQELELELAAANSRRRPATEAPAPQQQQQPKKRKRDFEWDRWNTRHIALRVAYVGMGFDGFARQVSTEETIERYLFDALKKTCLIADIDSCNFSRCGRTDKGVSALGQVVALDVRSSAVRGLGVIPREAAAEHLARQPHYHTCRGRPHDELNYVNLLNRVLPPEIRVLAWAPVPLTFDARFSCLYRTYKYYFARGALDLDRMRAACARFVGEHDFRNFCRMDVAGGVTNFRRRILAFDVAPCARAPGAASALAGLPADPATELCEFTITGMAFLWHQVRCMVAVLFMVGRGLEAPELVSQLLDVTTHPRKPQYGMASEVPLCLYDCGFEELEWHTDPSAHARTLDTLFAQWEDKALRASVLAGMRHSLLHASVPRPLDLAPAACPDRLPWHQMLPLLPETALPRDKDLQHKPMLQRGANESFEERTEALKRKADSSAAAARAAMEEGE